MTIRYTKRSRLDTWRLLHTEEAARARQRYLDNLAAARDAMMDVDDPMFVFIEDAGDR